MANKKALIVLFLLIVATVGFLVWEYHDRLGPQLSEAQKVAISAACDDASIGPVNWDAGDGHAGSVRYYGNYKGYDVFLLFEEPGVTDWEPWEPYYTIMQSGGLKFYAYKDGAIRTVEQLVEDGTFGDDELEKILKQHNHRRYVYTPGWRMEAC